MIMNIFYPDSGIIRTFGEEMKGTSTNRIGYLPEERGMYKKMKVRELLQFYGELKSSRKVDKEVDYWLDRLEAVSDQLVFATADGSLGKKGGYPGMVEEMLASLSGGV